MEQMSQQQVVINHYKNKTNMTIFIVKHIPFLSIATKALIAYMLLALFCYNRCQAQFQNNVNCDSSFMVYPLIGIEIDRKIFDSLVASNSIKIKNQFSFSSDECVDIIRIHNTICIYMLSFCDPKRELYQDYIESCERREVLRICIDKLNALPYTFMGYYSKEFDIEIGGVLQKKNSVYLLQ